MEEGLKDKFFFKKSPEWTQMNHHQEKKYFVIPT